MSAPEDAGQLKSYSLVPWAMEGKPWDYTGEISFTQWEKYPLSDPPVVTRARVTAGELALHWDKLIASMEESDVRPGNQCTFCPCRVQEGPWQWLSPNKYNISCWPGLVQLKTWENKYKGYNGKKRVQEVPQ